MFLNIQIDLIILKTYDQQFTLTTKKIIAYHLQGLKSSSWLPAAAAATSRDVIHRRLFVQLSIFKNAQ